MYEIQEILGNNAMDEIGMKIEFILPFQIFIAKSCS